MEKIKIGGIMQSDGRSLLRLLDMPDRHRARAEALSALGEGGVNIELLAESPCGKGFGALALVIDQKAAGKALGVIEEVGAKVGIGGMEHVEDVAVVSIFGPHLREKPLVPGRMFSALSLARVNTLAVSTSISSLSCVVHSADLGSSLDALNAVFDAPSRLPSGQRSIEPACCSPARAGHLALNGEPEWNPCRTESKNSPPAD